MSTVRGPLRPIAIALPFLCLLPGSAPAQPGCSLLESDFKLVTLASRNGTNLLEEPLKMAFDMDPQGSVDIYFVQRRGKLRKYSGASKAITDLGSVPANFEFEGGLTGIALDPAFKSNRLLYLYYGHGTGDAFRFRVSRFALDGAGKLDLSSEKVLLAIPAKAAELHTGGAMAFDNAGNLYITVGDNAAGEAGPGNTNDLRGKILRIKPTPEGSYQSPAGNLFPSGTAKTRPEIYIMGTRNAYTLAYDPALDLIAWGDVGPDRGWDTEEHNTASKAGNYGYPFYAGNQLELIAGGTPQKPINGAGGNTGLRELPPAVPATNAYHQSAAVTGPIYRHDPALNSSIKFPAPWSGLWFVTDFSNGFVDTVRLDAAGTRKLSSGRVFKNIRLDRPLDFQQGPDGALYVINYSGWFDATATTALARIEYRGCPTGLDPAPEAGPPGISVRGFAAEVTGRGPHALEILDLGGRTLSVLRGSGPGSHDLAAVAGRKSGVYLLRLATSRGILLRRVLLGP